MRVLVVAPSLYDTAPGQRFRIEQWARYLSRNDIHFTFCTFEDKALRHVLYQPGQYGKKALFTIRAFARRLRMIAHVRHYDLVYLYREAALLGPAVIERLIARRGVPIVYDFDDPLWIPYRSPTNRLFSRLKWPSKIATICQLATTVIVGNRLLASYAGQYAKDVRIVPSTIDVERYPVKVAHTGQREITLGWSGSHSTLPFLELLSATLERLSRRGGVRILVISHTNSHTVRGVSSGVIAKRWRSATEAADLCEMDIGLAPFPGTGWTPWRCHGKVLQYMAVGVPVVASPVGVVCDYIQDGVNGFLADTDAEWIEKVSLLSENPDLRRRIGMAGRETIEDLYSAQVWAPRVREILEAAAETR